MVEKSTFFGAENHWNENVRSDLSDGIPVSCLGYPTQPKRPPRAVPTVTVDAPGADDATLRACPQLPIERRCGGNLKPGMAR
jgi:hypothetical protein